MRINVNKHDNSQSFKGITKFIVPKESLVSYKKAFDFLNYKGNPKKNIFVFDNLGTEQILGIKQKYADNEPWFNQHLELRGVDYKLPDPLKKDEFTFYLIDKKDIKAFNHEFSLPKMLLFSFLNKGKIYSSYPGIKGSTVETDFLILKHMEALNEKFEKFLDKRLKKQKITEFPKGDPNMVAQMYEVFMNRQNALIKMLMGINDDLR